MLAIDAGEAFLNAFARMSALHVDIHHYPLRDHEGLFADST